jgi:ribonuclease D
MTETANLQVPAPCQARLITSLPDLEEVAARMAASPQVAIDTEADSLYSYSEKICLVQVSLPGEDFIIDPLVIYSLEPLADVFADPQVEKIFHGADYDLVSLKRGYGFHFANIFDTMLAARILGRKNIGLAALVAEELGLQMDKSQQRSDWGKRPLTREQLAYACHDTRYLMTLQSLLLKELQKAGREAEAREVFAELARIEPRSRFFDPDGFWNIKGVRDLDFIGQCIVRSLYRWREAQARSEDRPVFKVLSDKTMVALAAERPPNLDALRQSHIMSSLQVTRYGHTLLDMITKARRSPEHLQPPRPRRDGKRPDEVTLTIYENLRTWRRERAAPRGVEPDVIASNDLLMAVAMRQPRSIADLEGIAGLGEWRRGEYGAEMLIIVSGVLDSSSRRRRS